MSIEALRTPDARFEGCLVLCTSPITLIVCQAMKGCERIILIWDRGTPTAHSYACTVNPLGAIRIAK